MNSIDILAASAPRAHSAASNDFQWIDVRSASEFSTGHIPGAVNIPMDQIEARLDDLLASTPILLVCQSGKRARMVAGLLVPCRKDVSVLEGGITAWKAAGHPLVVSTKSRWSLERQVRLIAGLLVLTAVLMAETVHPYWIALAALVGLGLTFAGITDLCLMAALLVKLPVESQPFYSGYPNMRHVMDITDSCPAPADDGSVNFESLVNQHKDAVYRQMIRVCGNREDAEDVLIDALFKAYRNLDQLRDAVAFRAWLARIASRVCWQLRKREALLPILQLSTLEQEGRELSAHDTPIDSQVELSEMKALLRAAIAALPEPYRLVYEMRDLQNLEGAEVSRKLRISAPAMKSRLHRARALVRQQLDAALMRAED